MPYVNHATVVDCYKRNKRKPIMALSPAFSDAMKKGLCTGCSEEMIGHLLDSMDSYKEYLISGLCQRCQDDIFADTKK